MFLSAFMAGKIFVEYREHQGFLTACKWIFGRALRLYLVHLLLLILAFTVIAWIATTFDRPAARNLLDFYFQSPRKAVVTGAALVYRPPLLDILPMYILFFLGTPVAMSAAARWGWRTVLKGSVAIWACAQFGLRVWIDAVVNYPAGWNVPLNARGAFDLYAWQLLWVLGLWFGAIGFGRTRQVIASSGGSILNIALAVSCGLFAWRYYSGPMGFTDLARHLFWIDKWTLSPVRIINFAALLCVMVGFSAGLARYIRIPRIEALGRASLWVFIAHIGFVLLALCLIGSDEQPLEGIAGIAVIVTGYVVLFCTAAVYRQRRTRASRSMPCAS